MEGKTSITIAHRMATVRRAHTIYVIDDGIVSGRGTHEQLLLTSPLYARLFQLQFPEARLVET
jgi:ABC-type multidrug transport system fused ATPase/permease subunit